MPAARPDRSAGSPPDPRPESSPHLAELRRILAAEPPASVAALPGDVLRRLVEQIESGRRHHQRVAVDAVRTVIKGAPLPVRGIVRKALS